MSTPKKPEFQLRYDKSEITYINQFLVSPGKEEVLLDLSSGLINETTSAKPTLPIQTRVALPWSAVERLAKILNQVVAANQQTTETKNTARPTPHAPTVPKASMPQMMSEN